MAVEKPLQRLHPGAIANRCTREREVIGFEGRCGT